jgi:putative toxin-antitoxin system antitoxin component (TIGR02293 family)
MRLGGVYGIRGDSTNDRRLVACNEDGDLVRRWSTDEVIGRGLVVLLNQYGELSRVLLWLYLDEPPVDAYRQRIHEIIAAGFEPRRIKAWCEQSLFSTDTLSQVISMSTLHRRFARGQRLTLGESDRLFRLAHVAAMAEAVFGDKEKARFWLCKPKLRFAGTPPVAPLSTYLGTLLIEELLIEHADRLRCE